MDRSPNAAFANAIRDHKNRSYARNAATRVQVGATMTLGGNAAKFLHGEEVVVVAVKQKNAEVAFTGPVRNYGNTGWIPRLRLVGKGDLY